MLRKISYIELSSEETSKIRLGGTAMGWFSSEPKKPPAREDVFNPHPKAPSQLHNLDFSWVITLGNHSYVPLNLMGNPAGNAQSILRVLQAFEMEHIGWQIVNWHIEKQQAGGMRLLDSRDYVYGIWIDHEPKELKTIQSAPENTPNP